MSEKPCGQPAAFRYTWPGKDETHCCLDHGVQLQNVANAIGCHLQLNLLAFKVGDAIPDPWPTCAQKAPVRHPA